MRPIDATVPLTGPSVPSVLIVAWSPVLIWPTTLALTLALITSFALTTVIEPELPEPEPPDAPDVPDPPDPPSEPPPPDWPPPDWPPPDWPPAEPPPPP